MSDCIFCGIAAGEIAADVVAQDDDFVAFRDLRPLAPVHVLVIPRRHVESLDAARRSRRRGRGACCRSCRARRAPPA